MRDRLIRLAASHPTWALGFQDEVWWSRLARPSLRTWAEEDDRPRLVEQAVAKDDPDPKALACYGLLLRADPTEHDAASARSPSTTWTGAAASSRPPARRPCS
jgi:hypothetical protein